MAALQGMHVSPAKHSYVWLPRKCDYRTETQTDRQTPDKVIPMCRYALQATQKIKHVFVKQGFPQRQQSPDIAKISKSYILTPPHPRGRWCQWSMSNPYMNLQSKFGYCITQTLNIALCLWAGRNYRQADRQTDRRTDGWMIHLLDASSGPYRLGA